MITTIAETRVFALWLWGLLFDPRLSGEEKEKVHGALDNPHNPAFLVELKPIVGDHINWDSFGTGRTCVHSSAYPTSDRGHRSGKSCWAFYTPQGEVSDDRIQHYDGTFKVGQEVHSLVGVGTVAGSCMYRGKTYYALRRSDAQVAILPPSGIWATA